MTKNIQNYISYEDFKKQITQLLDDRYKSCLKELREDKDYTKEEKRMVYLETEDMINQVNYILFGKSQDTISQKETV